MQSPQLNLLGLRSQALYELHLQNNALVGPLPASWGARTAWRTLGWLDLHGNQLEGSVPAAWTPLTSLHKLHALCAPSPTFCTPACVSPDSGRGLGGSVVTS